MESVGFTQPRLRENSWNLMIPAQVLETLISRERCESRISSFLKSGVKLNLHLHTKVTVPNLRKAQSSSIVRWSVFVLAGLDEQSHSSGMSHYTTWAPVSKNGRTGHIEAYREVWD